MSEFALETTAETLDVLETLRQSDSLRFWALELLVITGEGAAPRELQYRMEAAARVCGRGTILEHLIRGAVSRVDFQTLAEQVKVLESRAHVWQGGR
ncbi:MAG: hypothetical protein KDE45_00365, partial [Caldilineaceae bacterium]|nr:hypothetical protein [Caldilineaceae bacterium]